MNRLWIRISLTIVGIILFLVILPLAFSIGRQTFDFDDNRLGFDDRGSLFERTFFIREESDDSHEEGFEDDDLYAPVPGYLVLRSVLQIMVVVTIVAVIAGIVLSRSLIKPLDNLVKGARALAAHDLSQRVVVKGSLEMQSVARAFNEMADELETAETLRSNMLTDVAHELRTPLTVLQGNLRAILDDIYALDKSEIARLYDQTRHLTRLVNDLREIAQAEANQLKLDLGPVDLAKLVKDVGINFSPIAEAEGINLELPIPDKVPSIQGDAARLTQCLHNLIDNALRHTPRAGTIQIKLQAGKKFVKISVSNDGDGISAEHLPHVFDRFYRYVNAGDRKYSGSGLGLAIVKSMVELHGGDVRVESQGSGKGTVFVIRLPIS